MRRERFSPGRRSGSSERAEFRRPDPDARVRTAPQAGCGVPPGGGADDAGFRRGR
jgi:hypothetical protein